MCRLASNKCTDCSENAVTDTRTVWCSHDWRSVKSIQWSQVPRPLRPPIGRTEGAITSHRHFNRLIVDLDVRTAVFAVDVGASVHGADSEGR